MPANNFEKSEASEKTRLQAYLAHCGVASRRASEQIILDGRVAVNGTIVTELGTKVGEGDVVTVDGKRIHLVDRERPERKRQLPVEHRVVLREACVVRDAIDERRLVDARNLDVVFLL